MQTGQPVSSPEQTNNLPATEALTSQKPVVNKPTTNWLLVGLVVLLFGTTGVFGYKYYELKKQIDQRPTSSVTPTKVTTISPSPALSPQMTTDPTKNWKTYTNSKFGYSFRYPDYFQYSAENLFGGGVYLAPSEGTEGEGKGSPLGLNLAKDYWLSSSATELDNNYWIDKIATSSNILIDGSKGFKSQVLPKEATTPAWGYSVSILRNNVLYRIDLLAGNEEVGLSRENEQLFNQILSTFKFTN